MMDISYVVVLVGVGIGVVAWVIGRCLTSSSDDIALPILHKKPNIDDGEYILHIPPVDADEGSDGVEGKEEASSSDRDKRKSS